MDEHSHSALHVAWLSPKAFVLARLETVDHTGSALITVSGFARPGILIEIQGMAVAARREG